METITLEGLAHPVDILIDHWGVPHIFADNESDAFLAAARTHRTSPLTASAISGRPKGRRFA
ncbi:penicillin acylase family protein [Paraburkholderia sp. A1RI-2L]|uniref:penicillin acylase family protein n=1 Tax=Paraburkholderia sp. A1RI-2L TaxID=3028367 RepID=UPI003B795802